MSNTPNRISAADIVVPAGPPAASPQPAKEYVTTVRMECIREMLEGCAATDRNDLLIISIKALIEDGVDDRDRIVSGAYHLGFKPGHAGAVLRKSEGKLWKRGADSRYRVLPE